MSNSRLGDLQDWEGFLKGYGKAAREPSINPLSSQEGTENDTSDSGKSSIDLLPSNMTLTQHPTVARAQSRSGTPEPERARHIADQDAINLPRYRHRSGSLLPGTQQGSDAEDIVPDAALVTPLDGVFREQTDSLLRPGARRGSGTGSILLAGGLGDSSFSAGDAGVDYAPVDLGFDLGLDLPPYVFTHITWRRRF